MHKEKVYKKIGPNQEVTYDEDERLGSGGFGIVYGGVMNRDA